MHTCLRCGVALTKPPGVGGRWPNYCSPECKRAPRPAPRACAACGEQFQPRLDSAAACRPACRERLRRQADPEAYRAANRERMREYYRKQREARPRAAAREPKHGASRYSRGCRCDVCREGHRIRQAAYYERIGGHKRKPMPKVPCEAGCGRTVRSGKCRACHHVSTSERRRRVKAKLRKAARGTRSRRLWVQGRCADCGKHFLSPGNAARFCSDACKRREASSRRRAREAGAKLTPGRRYRVHERDGWTCRLCGFPVDRTAKVPHPEAPVIDHIVALARGGEHAESNWQTAHFLCNSYKRDLDMSEVA